jgi:hypothetical protein
MPHTEAADPDRFSQVRPSELPGLRDQFATWLDEHGKSVLDSYSELSGRTDPSLLHKPAIMATRVANLYCVAPDMTELAMQAATASIDKLEISPHDLPSPVGLICFSDAIRIDRAFGQCTPIRGALWFRWQADGYSNDTVTVMWLADRYHSQFAWTIDEQGAPINPLFRTGGLTITSENWRDSKSARLVTHGMDNLLVEGSNPSSPAVIGDDEISGMTSDRAVLKATWLLMSQTLAEVEVMKVGPPRQKRRGRTKPRSEIRVIKLRRPFGTSEGSAGARDWQHRWLVRGHWRMQPWGPKRERVRPVWIAPHVKGPEGKPMLGGEKVYHLAR